MLSFFCRVGLVVKVTQCGVVALCRKTRHARENDVSCPSCGQRVGLILVLVLVLDVLQVLVLALLLVPVLVLFLVLVQDQLEAQDQVQMQVQVR